MPIEGGRLPARFSDANTLNRQRSNAVILRGRTIKDRPPSKTKAKNVTDIAKKSIKQGESTKSIGKVIRKSPGETSKTAQEIILQGKSAKGGGHCLEIFEKFGSKAGDRLSESDKNEVTAYFSGINSKDDLDPEIVEKFKELKNTDILNAAAMGIVAKAKSHPELAFQITQKISSFTNQFKLSEALMKNIDNPNDAVAFLKPFIKNDITKINEKAPETLFRGNSLATKLSGQFGNKFLMHLFIGEDKNFEKIMDNVPNEPSQKIIQDLKDEELKPLEEKLKSAKSSKLKQLRLKKTIKNHEKNIETTRKNIEDLDKKLYKNIEEATTSLLKEMVNISQNQEDESLKALRTLLVDANKEAIAHFGKEQDNKIVSNFFALRLSNPAIINTSVAVPREQLGKKKNLVLISKILQNVANHVEFGQKEEKMIAFNPVLQKSKEQMETIKNNLLPPPPSFTRERSGPVFESP